MAENRCPMCSKPNPEDADVCVFCQARIKPLVVGEGPAEAPSTPEESVGDQSSIAEEQGVDWLSRMRVDATAQDVTEEPVEEIITPDATPDWLGRLRDTQAFQDEALPEREIEDQIPESTTPEDAPAAVKGEVPDWLSRIREREAEESAVAPPEMPETGEGEWFSRLREKESAAFEEVEIPSALMGETEESPLETGVSAQDSEPDAPQPSWEDPAAMEYEAWEDEGEPLPEGESFIQAFEDPDSSTDAPASDADISDVELPWLAPTQPPPESTEGEQVFDFGDVQEGGVFTTDSAFDWLEPAEPPASISTSDEVRGGVEAFKDLASRMPEEGVFGMDVGPEVVAPEEPEPAPPEAVGPPTSPAFVLDADQPSSDANAIDLNLDDINLPDWLADMRESPAGPAAGDVVDDAALAPATLPSWLEAMRPIDSFRSVIDIESSEGQAVESAGPLAGLRGVLMAEPVVAMPRAATTGAAGLEVTERQFAQTELLQRILLEEARDQTAIIPRRKTLPFLRWIISFILVLTVALPSLLPSVFMGAMPIPNRTSNTSPDFSRFYTVIETVSTEQPALVVFDYTPGYNGELGTIAAAFLEHLMGRGVPVATLSTTPTGPSLAEALLSQYGVNWTDYIHLGYLSGGPTAVQVFAAAPGDAVPKGFRIPTELQDFQIREELRGRGQKIDSVWQSALLENVDELSDFSMIAVITSGPENARTWAEQAPPRMEGNPLIMILSAGAEPLVRPYYETTKPQVDAVLTGMPLAVAYEVTNELRIDGQTDAAKTKWDAYGFGMIAVQMIILGGGLYGAGAGLLRYGMKRAKGEVDD